MKKLMAFISSFSLFTNSFSFLIGCDEHSSEDNDNSEETDNELSEDMQAAIGENLIESGINASGLDENSTNQDAIDLANKEIQEVDPNASVTLSNKDEADEELDPGENHVEVKFKNSKNGETTTLNAEFDDVKKEHVDKNELEDLCNKYLSKPLDGKELTTNNTFEDTIVVVEEALHMINYFFTVSVEKDKEKSLLATNDTNKISVKITDVGNESFTKEIIINNVKEAKSITVTGNVQIDINTNNTESISSNKIDTNAKFSINSWFKKAKNFVKSQNLAIDEEQYRTDHGGVSFEEEMSNPYLDYNNNYNDNHNNDNHNNNNEIKDNSLLSKMISLVPHTKINFGISFANSSKSATNTKDKKHTKTSKTNKKIASKHRELIKPSKKDDAITIPVKGSAGKKNLDLKVNSHVSETTSSPEQFQAAVKDIFKNAIDGSSLDTKDHSDIVIPLVKSKLNLISSTHSFNVDFKDSKQKNKLLKTTNKFELKITSAKDKSMSGVTFTAIINNVKKPKHKDYDVSLLPRKIDAKIWHLNAQNTWKDVKIGIVKNLKFNNFNNYTIKIDKKKGNRKIKRNWQLKNFHCINFQ